MRKVWLVVLIGVAGCSGPKSAAGEGNVADNSIAAIERLPPPLQEVALFRAIRDAGMPCQDIVEVRRLPSSGGQPVWRAKCENGAYHVVQVSADGVATVLSRVPR